MREEKLEKANFGLYKEYVKRYKMEQEEILRVGINLAAYQISSLEKEKGKWNQLLCQAAIDGDEEFG